MEVQACPTGWYITERGTSTLSLDHRVDEWRHVVPRVGVRALRVLCRVSLAGGGGVLRYGSGVGQSTWRHAAGELVADHIYFGEVIDKRLATSGWRDAGFDDSNWSLATLAMPRQPPPTRLKCPKGTHVDTVDPGGTVWANHPYNDNGLCSCREYIIYFTH